jgi:RNA polymerase sigma-70 factor, ECF subfamily
MITTRDLQGRLGCIPGRLPAPAYSAHAQTKGEYRTTPESRVAQGLKTPPHMVEFRVKAVEDPANPEPGEITKLLHLWQTDDREAESRLFDLVQPELYRLAQCYMRRERTDHTLQPTALLNEAYIKLCGAKHVDWQDRRHFFRLTARAMRRLLIDYAKGHHSEIALPMEEISRFAGCDTFDAAHLDVAIAVDHLLDELGAQNREQRAMVELKFFLGLTDNEAADALHLPLRTVQRRWLEARKWLSEQLESQGWKFTASKTTNAS